MSISFSSFALVLATLVACGGASQGPTKNMPVAAGDPACPVAVAGTSVTVEDNDDGAALVFVTTGDVADVRRRANAMAKMHNDHHAAMGPLPDGKDAGHAGHDMGGHAGHDMGSKQDDHAGHAGGMIGVHSKATVSDREDGAKVAFVAATTDVATLQSELRAHAGHMASGSCAMDKP